MIFAVSLSMKLYMPSPSYAIRENRLRTCMYMYMLVLHGNKHSLLACACGWDAITNTWTENFKLITQLFCPQCMHMYNYNDKINYDFEALIF